MKNDIAMVYLMPIVLEISPPEVKAIPVIIA
jgi:hypothetical protein